VKKGQSACQVFVFVLARVSEVRTFVRKSLCHNITSVGSSYQKVSERTLFAKNVTEVAFE